jgi:hypothetical protein
MMILFAKKNIFKVFLIFFESELKNFVIQKPCLQRVKKKTNKKEKKGFKKA